MYVYVCLCMFMLYVYYIYICVCVYGERLHYVCTYIYILYKIYSMVEYAMARFKTLQDVHGLTRNAMRGLSNGANARGENFECQLTGGIRPGFADLRMIWLIFPINNL